MVGRWLSVLLGACVLSGCGDSYIPPTSDEPHARVLFQRDYDVTAGTTLLEDLRLLSQSAFSAASDVNSLGQARVDILLVRPEATEVTVSAQFVHYQYVLVQVYSGGNYPSSRWVYRLVQISDGFCGDSVWIDPKEGATYVLAFGTKPGEKCKLECFEESEDGDNGARKPCPLPTAEEKNSLEQAR